MRIAFAVVSFSCKIYSLRLPHQIQLRSTLFGEDSQRSSIADVLVPSNSSENHKSLLLAFLSPSRIRRASSPSRIPGAAVATAIAERGRSSHRTSKTLHPDTFSVAPMMDYTDKHLRYLLRLLSNRATLYTEMVVSSTLFYNEDVDRFLGYNQVEHPVVLQLGGSCIKEMEIAAEKALQYGYDDINLNCGCPSERVSGKGCFGAALMREPELVADLCSAISARTGKAATVKCRIGVDDEDSFEQLCNFVDTVSSRGGVKHFIIHARKAILKGLSPEQNRNIPPLKYNYVYDLIERFPNLRFTLNGGVKTYEDVLAHLEKGVHGVMLGRAITENPWMWSTVDSKVFGAESDPATNRRQVLEQYSRYVDESVAHVSPKDKREPNKIRNCMLRHLINLFHGEPNGRMYRAELSKGLLKKDLSAREIVEGAARVLFPATLDAAPGEVFDRDTRSYISPESAGHPPVQSELGPEPLQTVST